MLSRTRSTTQAILRLHPNKEVAHALHSIQPLLDQHKLQWNNHGQYPDCQFSSFIQTSMKTIPDMEEIMAFRKVCKNWLITHPPPLVESGTDWRDQIMPSGFGGTKIRKQVYNDPSFTSVEDVEDPMVIMNLDTKNVFGSLDARLVLDVLSGKSSRDYECGIKSGEDFETTVHELREYFGFFKLAHTCESTLRFF
jgi:hypothetical protein